MNKTTLKDIDSQQISDEELAILRVLRPYIGRCLTLNHDLNNPLAGIIGYCEVLLADADQLTESQRGYVQQVFACAERIKEIVDSLCEEKISLNSDIDLSAITQAYTTIADPQD